jgi:hypothetical protein
MSAPANRCALGTIGCVIEEWGGRNMHVCSPERGPNDDRDLFSSAKNEFCLSTKCDGCGMAYGEHFVEYGKPGARCPGDPLFESPRAPRLPERVTSDATDRMSGEEPARLVVFSAGRSRGGPRCQGAARRTRSVAALK